jgi:hypothetical protein
MRTLNLTKAKLSMCLIKHHAMKYVGMEVKLHVLTLTLDEGDSQFHALAACTQLPIG